MRYVLSTSVIHDLSARLQCLYTHEKLRQLCLLLPTTSRWMETHHNARILSWCMTDRLVSSHHRRVSKRHLRAEFTFLLNFQSRNVQIHRGDSIGVVRSKYRRQEAQRFVAGRNHFRQGVRVGCSLGGCTISDGNVLALLLPFTPGTWLQSASPLLMMTRMFTSLLDACLFCPLLLLPVEPPTGCTEDVLLCMASIPQ